jgi:DNA-binding NarL/FixJ family response regulator
LWTSDADSRSGGYNQAGSPVTQVSISVLIADDHPIFRDGLRRLLDGEPDLRVVGLAGNADEALNLTRTCAPDVLLLDLAMPGRNGLDVLRDLAAAGSDRPKVIVLTAAINDTQMVEALELGARGIVLKSTATELLLKCIRVVVAGQFWVGRDAVSNLVDGLREARRRRIDRAGDRFGLTPRQIEIVRAVVAGATNREIAGTLSISEDTVKQHLGNVFDKCGVSNRVELALFAVHHHIVES